MDFEKRSLTNGIFIGMGSNLGDRLANLRLAVHQLESSGTEVVAISPVYQSASWGKTEDPEYLNAVLQLTTDLPAEALLEKLLAIELASGRERPYRWAPRTLDLDLLYYHQQKISGERLTLPHPRISERRFVLKPMCDLAPAFLHPLLQKNQAELLERCTDTSSLTIYTQNLL